MLSVACFIFILSLIAALTNGVMLIVAFFQTFNDYSLVICWPFVVEAPLAYVRMMLRRFLNQFPVH